MTSSKIFTSLCPKPKQSEIPFKGSRRTQSTLEYGRQELFKHKREFSMPDYVSIDYPDNKVLRESIKTHTESQESLTRIDGRETVSPSPADHMIQSVLSGHRGWVTIDPDKPDRKKAAESFQPTNPT